MKTKIYRKYILNESFFDDVENWGEKQAYVLGWILSDGHIPNKGSAVTIALQKKDYNVLLLIKNIIEYGGPITIWKRKSCNLPNVNYQDRAVLCFTSSKIKEILNKLGFDNKKSSNMVFPYFLRKDLFPHFMRGYFDGDGCISYSMVGNRLLSEFHLLGTESFCDSFTEILENKLDIKFHKHKRETYGNGVTTIRLSGNKAMLKLFNYLYKDSTFFLKRKFKKFIKLINYVKKRPSFIRNISPIIRESVETAQKTYKNRFIPREEIILNQ